MSKKIKILFVPSGYKKAPATRYRIYQFLPFLDKEGIDYNVYSVISDKMTDMMIDSPNFRKFRKIIYYIQVVAEKFVRSWAVVLSANRYDIIFLQRTTFTFGLEKLLRLANKNIIFDIDDSIYMPDREEPGIIGRLKKYIKKKEVVSVLKISKCVIVENSHIKNFVSRYCNNICMITGPIDTDRNYPRNDVNSEGEITIGWIGSPSTTAYLAMLGGSLRKLSDTYKIKLRLIGASSCDIAGVKVEQVEWSEDTEVSELHKFDIGIMPMPDNEWTRGKVGCKMLQYMANSIPAVVSYTPTNAEVIEDGVSGFLARSDKEWVESLGALIRDERLRRSIGTAGRKVVEERYSLAKNGPIFLKVLDNIYYNRAY
jgi:L-malate glycosyltransferase